MGHSKIYSIAIITTIVLISAASILILRITQKTTPQALSKSIISTQPAPSLSTPEPSPELPHVTMQLPAPGSIVNSSILIRGELTSSTISEIGITLNSPQGTLIDTTTQVTYDSGNVGHFQTTLQTDVEKDIEAEIRLIEVESRKLIETIPIRIRQQ